MNIKYERKFEHLTESEFKQLVENKFELDDLPAHVLELLHDSIDSTMPRHIQWHNYQINSRLTLISYMAGFENGINK